MQISVDNNRYAHRFRSWALDAFLNTSWVDDPNITWFGRCIAKALQRPEKKSNGPFIIGLCGNAGTGKDSAIEYLRYCPYIAPSQKIAFADPIRQIAKLFGFTPKQLSDRKLKEKKDPFWGFSPRLFMQKVGTEMFRDCLRQDIWIKLLEKKVNDLKKDAIIERSKKKVTHLSFIFITDVRFPNEAKAIKKMGGYIVKIRRPGFSKSGENLHPSEKYIESIPADLELVNDAPDADTWAWYFAKYLTIFIKHDAFYR